MTIPRRWAQRLLLRGPEMRSLLLGGLCSVVLASSVLAGSRRCGDDVSGRPVPCRCGDVLVSSRALGADDPITQEPCAGAGLVVDIPAGVPSATLDFGAQTITGSGHGVGIQVLRGGADGLRLTGPGTIRGFDVGLLASGNALSHAANVTFADNARDGVSIAGDGYEVSGCEASRNGRDGFALRGRRYRVLGNRALSNLRNGFVLAGNDASVGDTLGNEASGNGRAGFVLRGRGHDVARPVAADNGGDGIRARIVTSVQGELASWTACRLEAETKLSGIEVRRGETIDFVVDCRADNNSDTFSWAPSIKMANPDEEWNALGGFGGPPEKQPEPLAAWEKYAQVLLEANEFTFVD